MDAVWWIIAIISLLGLLGALLWWIATMIPKKPRGRRKRKH